MFLVCLLQINILLNFSAGEDCPCPEEIQDELNVFHEELRLHCGTGSAADLQLSDVHAISLVSLQTFILMLQICTEGTFPYLSLRNDLASAGIPMEEEEEEQDTSIKGRLLALLYKIKGPPQKAAEEPTETEQAAPSKCLSA